MLLQHMIRVRGNPVLHSLDRYAGIPAIALFGRMKRRRALPADIGTIGLLKTAAIGDTVLISAVVADLREAFPSAELIFFAGESNFEAALLVEGLDRVLKVSVENPVAGLNTVRSAAVDVLLDFGQWSRLEALFTLFSGAAFTAGFRTPGQHRHCGYDVAVEQSSAVHELENFRRLVRCLGVETCHAPFLRVPQASAALERPYAVFHLWPGGSRKELKQWSLERWLLLVEDFTRWGMEVVLTGAASDWVANDAVRRVLQPSACRLVRNAAGLSLKETAVALARARLVVSVDTGMMHMAAALGAPVVVLHGPTSSKRWGPVSEKAVVIDSPVSGSGYLNLGWEYPRQPPACMEGIRHEAVRDACRAALSGQFGELRASPAARPEEVEGVLQS